MFPSANYFRDIPCPFFSRVACPRPHCHFKHVQVSAAPTISSNISSSSSSSITIPPDANETLNKLINQLSNAAAANSTATAPTNQTPSVDLTSILQSTLLQSLTTAFANALNSTAQTTNKTNELSEKSTQGINTIATQLSQQTQAKNAAETVPEYRPTPIVELERRKRIQKPPAIKPTIKTEAANFDSDEYVQATFSPPSTSPPPSVPPLSSEPPEEEKPKVSTVPKPIPKQSQPSNTDANHSWVTPPVRRKLSSPSDHNDFDERKSIPVRKVTPFERTSASTKTLNKPTATVKPNVIANTNKTVPPTNPMLKRIPKKTTPTKVRIIDIDIDQVPVTSTISLATESDESTSMSSTTLKRSSNGTNDIPRKKAKINSTASTTVGQNIKTKTAVTNGTNTTKLSDEDEELALFDHAFSPSKPAQTTTTHPPSSVQQFTSRYSSIPNAQDPSSPSVSTNRTRAETSTDGRRIAHQPKTYSQPVKTSSPTLLQPLVDPNSSAHKISFKTRQEYLTFFSNELKKRPTNSTSTTSVLTRAQTIEKEIFDKSTSKNSYLNLAAKYLRQLRSEMTDSQTKSEPNPPKQTNPNRLVVSHSAMLTSGNADNLSFGIRKKKEIDIKTLTDNELYTVLLTYKASERDLMENGYPAFSLDFPDKVLIKNKNPLYNSSIPSQSTDPYTRICCRCSKSYKITKDGEYLKPEECIYHWGRMLPQRVNGQIEKTYSCCASKTTAVGCAVAPYHVHDGNESQLLSGYVKTQPLRKQLGPDESYGIFALDCEMCYTINGLELVRISVVNHKLESIIDTLVKPHREILDYNTRWSGITEQHLRNCHVTFEDVQRRLLKLFSNKTILIGHSLESDLKALKIVHETVVDTSLVFPHPKGKPYKRALKTLMAEYLTKIIQENTEGHDSTEDAISCMELMLWKVKQDLKSSSTTC